MEMGSAYFGTSLSLFFGMSKGMESERGVFGMGEWEWWAGREKKTKGGKEDRH